MIHSIKIACSSSVAENVCKQSTCFCQYYCRSYVPCYTLVNVDKSEKYVTFNHYRKHPKITLKSRMSLWPPKINIVCERGRVSGLWWGARVHIFCTITCIQFIYKQSSLQSIKLYLHNKYYAELQRKPLHIVKLVH